jgi:Ca-activated chloride channel family protein
MQRIVVVCVLLLVVRGEVRGQDGVSSAAVSVARAGLPPRAEAVRVEEFINYHRHDLPQAMGAAVALDLRWGSPACGPGGEAMLQVGLATTRFRIDKSKIPALNIALVIDQSGSMQGERTENVKQALLAFVDQLRAGDHVSLVGFDDDAEVLLAAQVPLDREKIRAAIKGIKADGSTNLHAGLMLGYEQVAAHYDAAKTNRVILLTDGNANAGVTEDAEIVSQSTAMNAKEIDLSTIGVGYDFNHGLLRQLARSGRGLLHYVGDEKDIAKTFVDELESLLSPVARRIDVEIVADDSLELVKLHGYEPTIDGQRSELQLDDLNHGATQVILVRYRPIASADAQEIGVTVRLKYFDIARREEIREERRATIRFDPQLAATQFSELSVRKNGTVAEMAESLRAMASAVENEEFDAAIATLDASLKLADTRYAAKEDVDIDRMREIAAKYRKALVELRDDRKAAELPFAAP